MAFEDVYGDVASTSYAVGYYDSVNDSYLAVLRDLLPHGRAWIYDATTDMNALLEALSYSFYRVHERGLDLIEEFDPRTTYELLDDWERVLGLPGTNPSPATTTAQRRAAIYAKLLGYSDPTPAYFLSVAVAIVYTDAIIQSNPYDQFVAGSAPGDFFLGEQWVHAWRLIVEPISTSSDALLEWTLDSITPLHTALVLDYTGLTERTNPEATDLWTVAYHNGLLVAGGSNGVADMYLVTSEDGGVTWTERANPKNTPAWEITGIAHGNGAWVAVAGQDGGDAYIISSLDNGVTWTERTNPKNKGLYALIFDGTNFIAVGDNDGVDCYILTSPDGTTWTERANPKNAELTGIEWGNSVLVAFGKTDGADAYIVTSADNGATWTERANAKAIELHAGVYGNGTWVLVGEPDGGDAYILTSTDDGATWTERSNPKNIWLTSVFYNNGLFVAVGAPDGGDAYVITSPDGITWTERANPKNFHLAKVRYGRDIWVAAGWRDGSDAYIIVSSDGITWVEQENDQDLDVFDMVYDPHFDKWVFVGPDGGVDAYILTGVLA